MDNRRFCLAINFAAIVISPGIVYTYPDAIEHGADDLLQKLLHEYG